jgi:hypothetical protein
MYLIESILLTQYKSGGEAILIGLCQGLLIWGIVSLYRGVKKAAKRKDFEEIKENSSENNSVNKTAK